MRSLWRCIFALMTLSCAYDWTVVPDAGKKADAGSKSDASSTVQTCQSNRDCDAIDYCKFPDGLCALGEAGICTARPNSITCGTERNVCPCSDPRVRGSSCQFAAKGEDVSASCQ